MERYVCLFDQDLKKQILSMLVCVVMLIAILIVVIGLAGRRNLRPDFQPVAAADDTERIGFLRDLATR